jgi:hypothetical protein
MMSRAAIPGPTGTTPTTSTRRRLLCRTALAQVNRSSGPDSCPACSITQEAQPVRQLILAARGFQDQTPGWIAAQLAEHVGGVFVEIGVGDPHHRLVCGQHAPHQPLRSKAAWIATGASSSK